MSFELALGRVALVAFVTFVGACSRADLYPITVESAAGAGGGEGADAGSDAVVCPANAIAVGDATQTLTVGALSRSFILHVPSTYDGSKPTPLILDFHGLGASASAELASSPYPSYLDPSGVVMAFPSGIQGPAGAAWNVGPCCVANVDDVAFARAVVARVEQLACIDPKRVYAVGLLTGGGMAHYVACHAADVFAAAAPAAFDLLQENEADCVPSRPITLIAFRGTADTRVPYDGGASSLVPNMPITFLGARASFEAWARIDQCTGSPSVADENGCSSYDACAGGAEVTLCTKQGGSEEPGDPKIAWPELLRHTL